MEFNFTDEEFLAMSAEDVYQHIRNDESPFNADDLERWWYVHHWDN